VDAIVAGGSIIVKFTEGCACGSAYLVFQFFDERDVGGIVPWSTSCLARVEEIKLGGMVCCFSSFHTHEEVVVGFIYVDNSEAVDFVIAWFFFDHHSDYLLPSCV
jgi:hypothetical protein